ncbi:helix-turn-helix domain-containing protein [Psychrobacter sp. T6-5]|uniref:helix-turn-helix domain-containing protein n=1 Tax=Psychrobacter sp. T6-5 TaxID=3457451 RepID=UPI003FD55F59
MTQLNQFRYIKDNAFNQFTLLDAKMSDFSYSKHAHEEYSIGVTLKGRQDFFCQNAFHRSPAGGVIVFSPEEVHDGHSGIGEHLEYVMLYVHPNEFQPLFQALGHQTNEAPRIKNALVTDAVLARYVLLLKQMTSHNQLSAIETEQVLFNIAHSLLRHSGRMVDTFEVSSRKDSLLLRAKDYIWANLADDLSIDAIAAAANMSKYHFIRLFNQQFGLTPYQYVINCRVNLARQYIELGFAASRVALDAGFSDNSHLNRHFKRVFGITIKQYQRQLYL